MYFKNIKIKNYKCFEDTSIDNLGVPNGEKGSGLNILIGENGNGKTTLLEALNYLTLNSFTVDNKLSINDFNDFRNPIEISTEFNEIKCTSSIDFYNKWYFKANGIEFVAKNRTQKQRNKLLSSSIDSHSYFRITSEYIDSKGENKKEVDSRDKAFSNTQIEGDGINVFYFDKNRTRQLTTGNYKTTFEKILDDLNWRFNKNISPENESILLQNIAGEYFKNINSVAKMDYGTKTAKDFADFFDKEEFNDLRIDITKFLSPFQNAFFTIRKEGELKQINIKDLGSGVEIILTLLLLRNIANSSKGKIIYIIDEPEIHLHPKAQEKLLELLLEESKDKQIFISTHSPYMFKSSIGNGSNLLLLKKEESNNIEILNAREEGWGLFGKSSPTWGEINWFAYNLPTVEFHNELYGFIQAKAIDEDDKYYYEDKYDQYLQTSIAGSKNKTWIRLMKDGTTSSQERTLQTYIRNYIHHPENTNNEEYSLDELKASISQLIEYLK